jgi:hypothetical protein
VLITRDHATLRSGCGEVNDPSPNVVSWATALLFRIIIQVLGDQMTRPALCDVNNPELDEFYRIVGRVTVAGGHCEWAMQRIWLELTTQGLQGFPAAAKLTWTELDKKIVALAAGHGRADVLEVMQWAEDRKPKTVRHNVAHSYWWLTGAPCVRGARHYRRGGPATVVGTLEQLDKQADELFQFSHWSGSITSTRDW